MTRGMLVGHRRVAFLHGSTDYDHLRISCAVIGSLPARLVLLVVLGRDEAQQYRITILITKRFSKEKYLFKVRKKVSKHIWTNRKSCNDFRPTFDYLANRIILNNKKMGGRKQKEESSLLVPSTFLFLYQPSVCLCVSRVRAYLTTNQQVSYIEVLHTYVWTLISQKRYDEGSD
jgi:hypothetical protein